MDRPNDIDLERAATDLGALLVSEIAPEEQGDYYAIVQEYTAEKHRGASGDHPLALGMGEIIETASPYVYEAAKLVALYLIAQFGGLAKRITSDAIKAGETVLRARIASWTQKELGDSITLSSGQLSILLDQVNAKLTELHASKKMKDAISSALTKTLRQKE